MGQSWITIHRQILCPNNPPQNKVIQHHGARALDIQRGEALLMFEADLVDKTGRVIDHSFSWFLPGYFHFHVNRKIGII
jgi:hypothetical protein